MHVLPPPFPQHPHPQCVPLPGAPSCQSAEVLGVVSRLCMEAQKRALAELREVGGPFAPEEEQLAAITRELVAWEQVVLQLELMQLELALPAQAPAGGPGPGDA